MIGKQELVRVFIFYGCECAGDVLISSNVLGTSVPSREDDGRDVMRILSWICSHVLGEHWCKAGSKE